MTALTTSAYRRTGPGRSTATRMDTLDQQLQRLRDRQHEDDQLLQDALAGRAGAADWARTFGDEPERLLLEALPSLLVRRARRLAGVPRRDLHGLDPPLDLALEVLAHQPDEDIAAPLVDQMQALSVAPQADGVSPTDRWLAARALAVVGIDQGVSLRALLWRTGLVIDRAQEICDPRQWTNAALLDWEYLDHRLEPDLDEQVRGELERGAVIQFTYNDLATMLETGLFDELATDGQTRPDAANEPA